MCNYQIWPGKSVQHWTRCPSGLENVRVRYQGFSAEHVGATGRAAQITGDGTSSSNRLSDDTDAAQQWPQGEWPGLRPGKVSRAQPVFSQEACQVHSGLGGRETELFFQSSKVGAPIHLSSQPLVIEDLVVSLKGGVDEMKTIKIPGPNDGISLWLQLGDCFWTPWNFP